jgi:molecular chaperone DnaK (HSP70)
MSNYILGIDLGTTNSCVGVWRNNKPEIISNSQTGNRITPSVVYFKNENETLIGLGVNEVTKKYENLIYDSKRLIGRNFSDKEVQNDIKFWPFKLDKDNNLLNNLKIQFSLLKAIDYLLYKFFLLDLVFFLLNIHCILTFFNTNHRYFKMRKKI